MRARSSTDVPFERTETRSPVAIPRRSASADRERDLAPGALELELGNALDVVAGEQRPVAEEAEGSHEMVGPDRLGLRRRRLLRGLGGATYGARAGSGARSPTVERSRPS